MSNTADIADSAADVQQHLTAAEAALTAQGSPLPEWYVELRNSIHGLVVAGAWAVGEPGGAAIMGFRCQDRQPHQPTCVAYRAAAYHHDLPELVTCPQCKSEVHELFSTESGVCYPCWKDNRAAKEATR